MEQTLQFYIYVDGVNDAPFPNSTQQAILYEYKYDATRMGNAPIISGTIMHPSCLDELWDDNRVYVTFKGEKYFINQKPSSSYSNEDARYKHEVQLVSERSILNDVYFYDVVSEDTTSDKYFSNSADVVFYGDISELAKRLNYALSWAKLDYTVVVDSGISTDAQLVSFQNKFISDVLNDSYNLFKVPYYFVGKTIHLGYTNNVIDTTFKYGADNSLLSIAKNYSSDRIINRATGLGSSDNIPYYYPNFDPKGVSEAILNNSNNESVVIVNKRKYQKVKLGDVFTCQKGDSYTLDYIDRDKYSILEGFEKDKPSDKYPNEEPNYYIVVDYPFTVDIYHDTVINLEYDKAWFKGINARLYRNNELWERYNQLGSFYNYRLYEGDYHFTITLEVKLTDGRESFTDEDIPEVLDALQVSITTQISEYQQWVLNENSNVVKLEDYGLEMKVEPKNGDTITFKQLSYIPPQPNLMPSIYRETLGNSRFYNALNNTYLNPDNNEYYVFPNPYLEGAPKEQIQDFEDIKPTIKGTTNASGLRIDMFSEFAYDTNDNDEFDEEGNYLHPYFFAKLRKFDGTYGFNLFDHSIDEAEMSVSMTSGSCGACEFMIGVDDKTQKNIVQVDENGNLLRDSSGNVLYGSPQDRQNDTQNYEVWIALKKDINTFGVIMPNATSNYKPSSGDTFVILHIDLPDAYIIAAEKKLEQEIIKYIYENNSNKYNLSIAFSRIYLANNPSIANALNENAQLKVEYNNNIYTLYISSFSYNRSSDSALPEIRVELSQELGIKKTSLPQQVAQTKATLNNKIAKASQEVATTKNEVAQTKATVQENSSNLTNKVENLEQLIRTQQGDTADLKDSASAWTLDEQTTKARTTSKVLRTKYNVAIDNMLSLNEISDVGATLKDILESIGKWNELWQLDKDNNAIYTPLNLIVEGTLAMGNLGEGSSEAPVAGLQKVSITIPNYSSPFISDAVGNVTLPAYPTALKNPHSLIINGVHYDGSKEITINLEGGGGIADSVAWENVVGRPTALSEFENDLEFITYAALNGYATQSWVNDNYLSKSGGVITGDFGVYNPNSTQHTISISTNSGSSWIGYNGAYDYWFITDRGWSNSYALIHSGNIASHNAGSATKLQTASGTLYASTDGTTYSAFGIRGLVNYFDGIECRINYGSSNTTGFILNSSGSVLIGTTSDNGYKLDVNGSARFGSNAFSDLSNVQFIVSNAGYYNWNAYIGNTSGGVLIGYKDGVGQIGVNSYRNLAILPDGGNVLVGTTTDSGYKLDVNGSIRGTSLKIGDAELVWDNTNQALKIVGNAYVTKAFSMGELTESGSGGGGAAGIVTVRVNGYDYNSVNGIVTLPNYPTSLPASDVYAWAKAATKPAYTASEVGALSTGGGTVTGKASDKENALQFSSGVTYSVIRYNNPTERLGYIGFREKDVPAFLNSTVTAWYNLYHTGNFNPADYLPLRGGMISASSIEPLKINNTVANSSCYIPFSTGGVVKAYVGWSINGHAFLQGPNNNYIAIQADGAYYNGNTLYHSGNFNPANYLPLSGGTMQGDIVIPMGSYVRVGNAYEAYAMLGHDSSGILVGTPNLPLLLRSNGTSTINGNAIIHSGNYSDYALPLSGGTIKGSGANIFSINCTDGNPVVRFDYNGEVLGRMGYDTSGNAIAQYGGRYYTLIHSGNIGDYALPINTNIQLETDYNVAGYATSVGGWPGAGAAIALGDWQGYRMYLQGRNGVLRFNTMEAKTLGEWKTVAFTDSNVASATKLQTARTIWGQSFDGSANVSGALNLGVSKLYWASEPEHYYIGFDADNYTAICNYYGLKFLVSQSEKMRIAYSGNVLVGTTSDNGAKLRVYGGIWADETITSTSAIRTLFYGTATCGLYPNTWITNDGVNNRLWLYNDNQLALYGSEIQLRNTTKVHGDLIVYRPGSTENLHIYVRDTQVVYQGYDSDGYVYHDFFSNDTQIARFDGYNNCLTVYNFISTQTIYTTNWVRSYNATGWFNETYGGGIYMEDSTYVKVYNGKSFWCDGDIIAGGTMAMAKLASSSDRSLKNNIAEVSAEQSMSIIRQLRPTTWNWKKDGKKSYGFIAQEVEPIVPEMVVNMEHLHLEYNQLHAFEIGAIQHIDSEVEQLKIDLKAANEKIEQLESKLKQYELWQ